MSLRTIGVHVSQENKIEFQEQKEGFHCEVIARVSNTDGSVKVLLPEVQNNCNPGFSSLITRVESLLRNLLLKPVYLAEKQAIHFVPTFSGNTSWEKVNEMSFSPSVCKTDVLWICQADGKISYAWINTVKTWDPINNTWTMSSYHTARITALWVECSPKNRTTSLLVFVPL